MTGALHPSTSARLVRLGLLVLALVAMLAAAAAAALLLPKVVQGSLPGKENSVPSALTVVMSLAQRLLLLLHFFLSGERQGGPVLGLLRQVNLQQQRW